MAGNVLGSLHYFLYTILRRAQEVRFISHDKIEAYVLRLMQVEGSKAEIGTTAHQLQISDLKYPPHSLSQSLMIRIKWRKILSA